MREGLSVSVQALASNPLQAAAVGNIGREVRPQGYVYAQRVECEEPCEGRLSLNLNSYRSSETRASGVYQSRSDCQAIVMTSKWLLV